MKKNKDDKVKMKEQNDKEHKPFIKSIKFQFIICSICAIILVFSLDFNPPKQSIPLFFYGSHVFILLASLILYLDLIYIKNKDIIKIWKMFVFFCGFYCYGNAINVCSSNWDIWRNFF